MKVTIRIWSREAGGWSATRQARQRSTKVRVLPVPAPATTSTLPRAAMAACWAEVRLIVARVPGLFRAGPPAMRGLCGEAITLPAAARLFRDRVFDSALIQELPEGHLELAGTRLLIQRRRDFSRGAWF